MDRVEKIINFLKYILRYRLKEVLGLLLVIAIIIIFLSLNIIYERNPKTGKMELQKIEKPSIKSSKDLKDAIKN